MGILRTKYLRTGKVNLMSNRVPKNLRLNRVTMILIKALDLVLFEDNYYIIEFLRTERMLNPSN